MKAGTRFLWTLSLLLACDDPQAAARPGPEPAPAPAPDPAPEPAPEKAPEPQKEAAKASRPAEDLARDTGRKPQAIMDFFEIRPGSKVVELQAGRGYYSELLVERVGREGAVWAHNNAFVMDRFARGPLTKRLDRIGAPNLKVLESELDEPKLPEGLDAVLIVLFYHDTYWQGVDRAKMNRAVFEALEPGGVYGVVDHHAEADSGDRDVKTLHRVDMELVKKEILEAGFVLDASSDLLANPEDTHKDNVFKREPRDNTDRFVLRFKKPAAP